VINVNWSANEISLLELFFIKKGEDYLSNLINRSPNAIRVKATNLGIKKVNREIKISPEENQIILGSLFGDMHCRIRDTCKNAQLEEAHSKKQKSYLFWKIKQLKNIDFNYRITKNGAFHFESRTYSVLNPYRDIFYNNSKKMINNEVLDNLRELGLAVWYMDDGSYNKKNNYCVIYTNCFSYGENKIIKEWFKKQWNISPNLHSCFKRNKRFYYIAFNKEETKKFIKIIKPYIHPSMNYKIGIYAHEKNGKTNGGVEYGR